MGADGDVFVRADADLDTRPLVARGASTALAEERDDGLTADRAGLAVADRPGPPPGTVLVSVPEGRTTDICWRSDLSTGVKQKLDFEGAAAGEVNPLYQARRPSELIGFARTASTTTSTSSSSTRSAGRAWAAAEDGLPRHQVGSPVSWTPDYCQVVVRTSGGDDSGTYLLVDRPPAGGQARLGLSEPHRRRVNEVRYITLQGRRRPRDSCLPDPAARSRPA